MEQRYKKELIVRGRTPEGKWVEGFYVHFKDPVWKRETHRITSGITEAGGLDLSAPWEDIDPDTLGRFTGMTDKNGRDIYEGDILRADYYPFNNEGVDNYLGVVFFADEDFTWKVKQFVMSKSRCRGISNFSNTMFYDQDFSQMEVIGNVWDSKGLFRDSDEAVVKWFKG